MQIFNDLYSADIELVCLYGSPKGFMSCPVKVLLVIYKDMLESLLMLQELLAEDSEIKYEPAHEIRALFVLRYLILQSRMRSHPVGLDV